MIEKSENKQSVYTKTILLIRSMPLERLEGVVAVLRKDYPGCSLDLLLQEDIRLGKDLEKGFGKIFSCRKGKMEPGSVPEDIRREICARAYEMACVVYNNFNGDGYYNVLDMAEAFKPKKLLIFEIDDEHFEIEPGYGRLMRLKSILRPFRSFLMLLDALYFHFICSFRRRRA